MSYTKDQLNRIREIDAAARNLINLLIQCPDYLSDTVYTQVIAPPIKDTTPTMAADLVSNMLANAGYVVFYPNHVETVDPPVEYISEVYETEEQMENHIKLKLQ